MRLGLGISIAIVLVGLSFFSTVSQVFSATNTPTALPSDATKTPAAEATAELESGDGYEAIADEFFTTLADKGGKEALTYVFATNPYSSRIEDQLNVVINQYTSAEQVLGDYVGYDLLLETKVSDRLVVQYYLVIYERQPLKFELAFYKPKDEWVFQNFSFTDIVEDIATITRLSLDNSDKVTIIGQNSGSLTKDMAFVK